MKTDPLWYKDAVIYQLHVKSFFDGNDDGIGDFKGLKQKLGYFRELGVTALWLLPFYPSPLKDDGYDISGFKGIHPNYGSLRDFKTFLSEAHKNGIRVITELVINHTSDQHPWFQRARHARPESVWRNFYIWSDSQEKFPEVRVIFQDYENSNWTWDPVAGAYYFHRFYSHQPDLNYDNPKVHEAVFKALEFWMDMGVDGMRLDAVPYLYKREGADCENLPETHMFLKKLRAHMDEKYQGRMFLAEANQWLEDAAAYFGDGDECHMNFNFPLMPRLYMSLHMESRFPVTDIIEHTPPIPDTCQWAIFLRNHDELTLEMVTDEERDYMYRAYAADPRMRLNLGIRRRLSPLLGNHRRRIELMNALLLSLPGTPVIYYGDEIGMGDNIYLGDRNGVRTPMQWSWDRNAGFSRANPHKLYLPVIIDPEYHFEVVNVEAQKKNRHSLFWWMRRLITLRRRIPAFSRGDIKILDSENPRVLAFVREYETQRILVVVNFSRFVQYVELDLSDYRGAALVEIFGNTPFPPVTEVPYFLTLSPHAFYWFNLRPEDDLEISTEHGVGWDRLPLLETEKSWKDLFAGDAQETLVKFIPKHIKTQRWFGGKSRRIKSAAVDETIFPKMQDLQAVILFIRIEFTDGANETYVLPVVYVSRKNSGELFEQHPGSFIARIRVSEAEDEGALVDGMAVDAFRMALLDIITRRGTSKGAAGRISGTVTRFLKTLQSGEPQDSKTTLIKGEQSNTSVVYGDRYILKLYRRLGNGTNPDLEIGRFLTMKGFQHTPLTAGALEYRTSNREEPQTLALLQAYVRNQGDAWEYTLNHLSGYFDRVMEDNIDRPPPRKKRADLLDLAKTELPKEAAARIGVYIESARLLGKRTAEMHNLLASEKFNDRFAPESFSKLYQRALFQSMNSLSSQVLPRFRKQLKSLPEHVREIGERILERKSEITGRYKRLTEQKIDGKRIRCHGDYHLGQVLYTGKDFIIIDFEGEPLRPITERRIKRSPLRDAAGMLRSFHYAVYKALADAEHRGAFHAENRETMEIWAKDWCLRVCSEFLSAYLETGGQGGYLPESRYEIKILLDAFLMEKAVYELDYEMNNRPEWIKIPLEGIEELLNFEG